MVQSILHTHHQIALIYKPDYVSFLLKHSSYKRESKQLSMQHFTFCSILFFPCHVPHIQEYHVLFHILFNTSIFTGMILCPAMPVSHFLLVKSYLFFRNQIKYHFLGEAIYDFPRIVSHPFYYHPKEFCTHSIMVLKMWNVKIYLHECFLVV